MKALALIFSLFISSFSYAGVARGMAAEFVNGVYAKDFQGASDELRSLLLQCAQTSTSLIRTANLSGIPVIRSECRLSGFKNGQYTGYSISLFRAE